MKLLDDVVSLTEHSVFLGREVTALSGFKIPLWETTVPESEVMESTSQTASPAMNQNLVAASLI